MPKKLEVKSAVGVHSPKSAGWKVGIAAHLPQAATATLPWITEKIHVGSPQAMSRYVAECEYRRRKRAQKLMSRLQNVKGSV